MGGTTTRVASSKDMAKLHKIVKFPTNKAVSSQKLFIEDAILKVSDRAKVEFVCFGVPGTVDTATRKFLRMPNYPALNGKDFSELIDTRFGELVFVENDAALAALAEATLGSGKNAVDGKARIVAYLALGTGVGGARVDRTTFSYLAAEPGHQIISAEGRLCKGCGQHGCLEAYASGTSFTEMFGCNPIDCSNPAVWQQYASYLAIGIINVISMWRPDIIVLGGSVSNKFLLFEGPLRERLKELNFFDIPPIVKSQIGDEAGVYGGFLLTEKVIKKLVS